MAKKKSASKKKSDSAPASAKKKGGAKKAGDKKKSKAKSMGPVPVKIGKGAEEKIREAARQSDLLKAAQEQGNELFDLIEFMVTNAGWTLVVRQEEPAAGPDSLWGDF